MDPSERYRKLTQIFIAICNLDGVERLQELNRLCGFDPDLRGEVELLLSFHDRTAAGGGQGPSAPSGR